MGAAAAALAGGPLGVGLYEATKSPKGPTPPQMPAPPPSANPPSVANVNTAATIAKNKAAAAGLAGQTDATGPQGLKPPSTGKATLLGETAS